MGHESRAHRRDRVDRAPAGGGPAWARRRGRGAGASARRRPGVATCQWNPSPIRRPCRASRRGRPSRRRAGAAAVERAGKERIRTSRRPAPRTWWQGCGRRSAARGVGLDLGRGLLRRPRRRSCSSESAPPGDRDFLAEVCLEWEGAAERAASFGVRVVTIRNGVVLDQRGGALKRCCRRSRPASAGRSVAGGRYMPWIALDDVVGIVPGGAERGGRAAATPAPGEGWSGAVNAAAP